MKDFEGPDDRRSSRGQLSHCEQLTAVSIRFWTRFKTSVGDDHERRCGSVAVCGGYANGHESAFTPDKREVAPSTGDAAEAAAGDAARAAAGQSALVDRVPPVDGVECMVVPAKADIGGGAAV